ncbi:MAG: DNA mismatch repair endonuclease MutL [Bacteroidales bacterium]|nr:DNA mismatch repair endonuclease MutL [Bacteroidales bacterium]
MDIRILPGNIASMIAAGEVVQRPASVVKELVENAVDAGADRISVIIQDAGRTLIQVIDNGCGMSPDDAVVCFERHATSKLATAEDLDNILTFGFRGEALASIASIAEVTLRTKREGDSVGCEVRFAASRQTDLREVQTARGANFAVRNLFYNVPARRKFLKSDNVEFKHIVEEFQRVALTRPEIGFTLNHNGKDIYVLKPAKSLKFRIQDLMGSSAVEELLDVSADTSIAKIYGFTGRPDTARKGLGNQFFFVNGRYFRSPYLHKAVMNAYTDLIPQGVTPSYFLFFDVAPYSVDVNISPTKTEIKFEEDSIIFQTLYAAIKETLGKQSLSGDIDFDTAGAPEIPVFGNNFEDFHVAEAPVIGTDPDYNPFDGDGFPADEDSFGSTPTIGEYKSEGSWGHDSSYPVHKSEDYGKLFEEKSMARTTTLSLGGRYILSPTPAGLMIVNVRRACERIFYEKFLSALSGAEHVTQTMLFPVQVKVGVPACLLIADNMDMLSSLGFEIRPLGTDTVVVSGVPEGYSAQEGKVRTMIDNIVAILSDGAGFLQETMAATMAEKFALLAAMGTPAPTAPLEAQNLIDTLFACDNPRLTASGRKVAVVVSLEDIDKKF